MGSSIWLYLTLWLHGSLNEDDVQPTTKCRYCTRNLCPPLFQDNPLACAMMQAMMTPMSGSEDHPGLTVWWIFCIAHSSPCELHCYKNQSRQSDLPERLQRHSNIFRYKTILMSATLPRPTALPTCCTWTLEQLDSCSFAHCGAMFWSDRG